MSSIIFNMIFTAFATVQNKRCSSFRADSFDVECIRAWHIIQFDINTGKQATCWWIRCSRLHKFQYKETRTLALPFLLPVDWSWIMQPSSENITSFPSSTSCPTYIYLLQVWELEKHWWLKRVSVDKWRLFIPIISSFFTIRSDNFLISCVYSV